MGVNSNGIRGEMPGECELRYILLIGRKEDVIGRPLFDLTAEHPTGSDHKANADSRGALESTGQWLLERRQVGGSSYQKLGRLGAGRKS